MISNLKFAKRKSIFTSFYFFSTTSPGRRVDSYRYPYSRSILIFFSSLDHFSDNTICDFPQSQLRCCSRSLKPKRFEIICHNLHVNNWKYLLFLKLAVHLRTYCSGRYLWAPRDICNTIARIKKPGGIAEKKGNWLGIQMGIVKWQLLSVQLPRLRNDTLFYKVYQNSPVVVLFHPRDKCFVRLGIWSCQKIQEAWLLAN